MKSRTLCLYKAMCKPEFKDAFTIHYKKINSKKYISGRYELHINFSKLSEQNKNSIQKLVIDTLNYPYKNTVVRVRFFRFLEIDGISINCVKGLGPVSLAFDNEKKSAHVSIKSCVPCSFYDNIKKGHLTINYRYKPEPQYTQNSSSIQNRFINHYDSEIHIMGSEFQGILQGCQQTKLKINSRKTSLSVQNSDANISVGDRYFPTEYFEAFNFSIGKKPTFNNNIQAWSQHVIGTFSLNSTDLFIASNNCQANINQKKGSFQLEKLDKSSTGYYKGSIKFQGKDNHCNIATNFFEGNIAPLYNDSNSALNLMLAAENIISSKLITNGNMRIKTNILQASGGKKTFIKASTFFSHRNIKICCADIITKQLRISFENFKGDISVDGFTSFFENQTQSKIWGGVFHGNLSMNYTNAGLYFEKIYGNIRVKNADYSEFQMNEILGKLSLDFCTKVNFLNSPTAIGSMDYHVRDFIGYDHVYINAQKFIPKLYPSDNYHFYIKK